MKKDAEQNRAQDEARQSLMKAKDAAQRDIQHVQKGISSFTSLSPHLRDSLKAALDKASDVASSSTSVEDIEAAVQEMKQVTGPLLTEAYQTQGKAESNTNE
jgi:molecular chaperone DnaK (HSP70)